MTHKKQPQPQPQPKSDDYSYSPGAESAKKVIEARAEAAKATGGFLPSGALASAATLSGTGQFEPLQATRLATERSASASVTGAGGSAEEAARAAQMAGEAFVKKVETTARPETARALRESMPQYTSQESISRQQVKTISPEGVERTVSGYGVDPFGKFAKESELVGRSRFSRQATETGLQEFREKLGQTIVSKTGKLAELEKPSRIQKARIEEGMQITPVGAVEGMVRNGAPRPATSEEFVQTFGRRKTSQEEEIETLQAINDFKKQLMQAPLPEPTIPPSETRRPTYKELVTGEMIKGARAEELTKPQTIAKISEDYAQYIGGGTPIEEIEKRKQQETFLGKIGRTISKITPAFLSTRLQEVEEEVARRNIELQKIAGTETLKKQHEQNLAKEIGISTEQLKSLKQEQGKEIIISPKLKTEIELGSEQKEKGITYREVIIKKTGAIQLVPKNTLLTEINKEGKVLAIEQKEFFKEPEIKYEKPTGIIGKSFEVIGAYPQAFVDVTLRNILGKEKYQTFEEKISGVQKALFESGKKQYEEDKKIRGLLTSATSGAIELVKTPGEVLVNIGGGAAVKALRAATVGTIASKFPQTSKIIQGIATGERVVKGAGLTLVGGLTVATVAGEGTPVEKAFGVGQIGGAPVVVGLGYRGGEVVQSKAGLLIDKITGTKGSLGRLGESLVDVAEEAQKFVRLKFNIRKPIEGFDITTRAPKELRQELQKVSEVQRQIMLAKIPKVKVSEQQLEESLSASKKLQQLFKGGKEQIGEAVKKIISVSAKGKQVIAGSVSLKAQSLGMQDLLPKGEKIVFRPEGNGLVGDVDVIQTKGGITRFGKARRAKKLLVKEFPELKGKTEKLFDIKTSEETGTTLLGGTQPFELPRVKVKTKEGVVKLVRQEQITGEKTFGVVDLIAGDLERKKDIPDILETAKRFKQVLSPKVKGETLSMKKELESLRNIKKNLIESGYDKKSKEVMSYSEKIRKFETKLEKKEKGVKGLEKALSEGEKAQKRIFELLPKERRIPVGERVAGFVKKGLPTFFVKGIKKVSGLVSAPVKKPFLVGGEKVLSELVGVGKGVSKSVIVGGVVSGGEKPTLSTIIFKPVSLTPSSETARKLVSAVTKTKGGLSGLVSSKKKVDTLSGMISSVKFEPSKIFKPSKSMLKESPLFPSKISKPSKSKPSELPTKPSVTLSGLVSKVSKIAQPSKVSISRMTSVVTSKPYRPSVSPSVSKLPSSVFKGMGLVPPPIPRIPYGGRYGVRRQIGRGQRSYAPSVEAILRGVRKRVPRGGTLSGFEMRPMPVSKTKGVGIATKLALGMKVRPGSFTKMFSQAGGRIAKGLLKKGIGKGYLSKPTVSRKQRKAWRSEKKSSNVWDKLVGA